MGLWIPHWLHNKRRAQAAGVKASAADHALITAFVQLDIGDSKRPSSAPASSRRAVTVAKPLKAEGKKAEGKQAEGKQAEGKQAEGQKKKKLLKEERKNVSGPALPLPLPPPLLLPHPVEAAMPPNVSKAEPQGRAVQVDPIKPMLKPPGTKRVETEI